MQGTVCFFKSLPWLNIETYVSKLSFYRNIVRENVLCDGTFNLLNVHYFNFHYNKTVQYKLK